MRQDIIKAIVTERFASGTLNWAQAQEQLIRGGYTVSESHNIVLAAARIYLDRRAAAHREVMAAK